MMNKVILYGAASIGGIVHSRMEQQGFEVIAYLDKRAFEISECNGVPVYYVDSVPDECKGDDTFVFVAVKNVFDHQKIANLLYENGFKKIVYKPYNLLVGIASEKQRQLGNLYDLLFDGKAKEEDTNLLENRLISAKSLLHDFAFIAKDEGYVTAYIPTEFIYTNNYQDGGMVKWGNVPIAALFTHINFFRSMAGYEEATVEEYLEEYIVYTAKLHKNITVTQAWKENALENRAQIYDQMKEALDLDKDFFIRNAATAVWNDEKKCFNLTSGKHRCTFLTAQGSKYIPLRIKKEDYEKFLQREICAEIACLLADNNVKCVIPNPYFYRGIHAQDCGDTMFLLWFSRCFGEILFRKYSKVDFSKLSILDYTSDYGHFSRYLIRSGAHVKRYSADSEVEKSLDKMFVAVNEYIKPVDDSTNVTVLDTDSLDLISSRDFDRTDFVVLKYVSEKDMLDLLNKIGCHLWKKVISRYSGISYENVYLLQLVRERKNNSVKN